MIAEWDIILHQRPSDVKGYTGITIPIILKVPRPWENTTKT